MAMDRCRAPTAVQDHGDADDSDELGVFAAERYFYGDDAPWGERSWSSLSPAFRTGTHEQDRSVPTPTAATTSSEASWNSRSALLPSHPAEKVRPVASTPVVEARPFRGESERTDRGPASSSNLRRWLLGMAGCACAGGLAEESVSSDSDEMDPSNSVLDVGGRKYNAEARELFPKTEDQQEPAFEEATAARVRPGSSRWLLGGDDIVLGGKEAFSPIELEGDGRHRVTNPGELYWPILHTAATATSDERRRIESLEMFRPVGDQGSAKLPVTTTIVAGNTALGGGSPRGASGGGGSPAGDPRLPCGGGRRDSAEDDAAPSELGCAYPPSEASVVWSVVTADGAASGNFSSAASGYYYRRYIKNVEDGATRRAAMKSSQKRRSGFASNSSLLTCMSKKATDVVGPAARSIHRREVEPAAVPGLGTGGGSGNGHGGRYKDVTRSL